MAISWNDWVTIAAVAIACGLAAYVGVPVLREFEHDVFFVLGNAYRVAEGQIPHRDFSSAFGPVFFLIQAGGLAISGMRPEGIGHANAIFGSAIALWMYGIARNRLTAAAACILAIYTVLLITAPFSLGYNPAAFSYAMLYNRYGYALLGIVLVECGLQALRTPGEEMHGAARGILAGAAWALLVFLKISYGIVAVPFLVVWIWCGAGRGRRLVALCGGFGAVALALLCYLRFDLADMFRDLGYVASGRGGSWRPESMLSPMVAIESFPLLLLAAVASAGAGEAGERDASWSRARVWLFALLTVGVGAFLFSTNHQAMSLPLDGFAAVVLVHAAMQREAGGDRSRWLAAMFLAALCLLPLTLMNGVSLVAASWERYHGATAAVVRLKSEWGASMIFSRPWSALTSETGGAAYVDALNDGLDLIRTRTGPGDGVLTIDTLNPFNYLLNRPSPRGGMATANYNLAFSDAAHPSAARYFGEARWVLVRKYSRTAQDFAIEDFEIQGLLRVYGPALDERFRPVAETAHWALWRRK